MESWLPRQSQALVAAWEQSIGKYYPEHLRAWTDPIEHLRMLNEEWNLLHAARLIPWGRFTDQPGTKVLDLGSGTGWLSAELSRIANVSEITALDASKHNLSVMMPAVIPLLNGDASKIQGIEGLFSPLPVSDGTYDLVVSSSAIHHAPSMLDTLQEMARVLKPGGHLVLLNETPVSRWVYFKNALRIFLSVTKSLMKKGWHNDSKTLSRTGILYDPYLGDRMYCHWHFHAAIKAAGFACEEFPTGLLSYQNRSDGPILTHYYCHKAERAKQ